MESTISPIPAISSAMLYICKGLVKSAINWGNLDIISGGISTGIVLGIKLGMRLLAAMVLIRLRAPAVVKGMPT